MKAYLTDDNIKDLKNKGVLDKEIEQLKETLKWYYKKYNGIKVDISGDAILKLNNISDLLRGKAVYGIKDVGVIRELVLKELDKENPEYLYKDLCTATIRNAAPDYMDMGGTQYYRIYLKESGLKLYKLDNFFRLVEVKEYSIEDIKSCYLKDSLKFEGETLKIYYMLINVVDEITNGRIFIYSTKKINESRLPELYKLLREKGVKEEKIERKQKRVITQFAKWMYYGLIIIFIIILCIKLL
ncbi:hypothetical protein [uncultured Clostridium sp.]|uniref:hypothetical protein n=1 Tax=uncultured Clostridium sp. TaxID=59620 RepID=UPI0026274AB8|nr:hypothetical protein [uncultured Clostridium sp.]